MLELKENEDCIICHETFDIESANLVKNIHCECKHTYMCIDCIGKLTKCPTCKTDYKTDEIYDETTTKHYKCSVNWTAIFNTNIIISWISNIIIDWCTLSNDAPSFIGTCISLITFWILFDFTCGCHSHEDQPSTPCCDCLIPFQPPDYDLKWVSMCSIIHTPYFIIFSYMASTLNIDDWYKMMIYIGIYWSPLIIRLLYDISTSLIQYYFCNVETKRKINTEHFQPVTSDDITN
jgi:hypothetical protein